MGKQRAVNPPVERLEKVRFLQGTPKQVGIDLGRSKVDFVPVATLVKAEGC